MKRNTLPFHDALEEGRVLLGVGISKPRGRDDDGPARAVERTFVRGEIDPNRSARQHRNTSASEAPGEIVSETSSVFGGVARPDDRNQRPTRELPVHEDLARRLLQVEKPRRKIRPGESNYRCHA